MIFPKRPLPILSPTSRSMTVSLSPSSIPVNSACSDFFSMTFIFLMYLAGIFFVASLGSFRKNVFPPIVILLTFSPLTRTLPSSSTSTPGSFFSKSSSKSLSVIRYEPALYSTVSFLMTILFPAADIVAASRASFDGFRYNVSRLTSDLPSTTFLSAGSYPSNSAFNICEPEARPSKHTCPSASDTA